MGGRADIGAGVVQDKVLEMDQLVVDSKRCAGISELGALKEADADRRTGNTFVQTRMRDTGVESRPYQGCHADCRDIVSH